MLILNAKDVVSLLNRDHVSQSKILLIEDGHTNGNLIRLLQDQYPFTLIDHATTKAEALELLMNNKYDTILLDLHRPITANQEDFSAYRKLSQSTPLIAITRDLNETTLYAAKTRGASAIVSKAELTRPHISPAIASIALNMAYA